MVTTTTSTETREETNRAIMVKSAERLPGTSTRLRTRDDGCCSVNFLKYVLHIYNVVLFVSTDAQLYRYAYTRLPRALSGEAPAMELHRQPENKPFTRSRDGFHGPSMSSVTTSFRPRERSLLIVIGHDLAFCLWSNAAALMIPRECSRKPPRAIHPRNVPAVS